MHMQYLQAENEINTLKWYKKLTHCIAISIIVLTTAVAAIPILFSIIKINDYGGLIIIGTSCIYLICLLVIIAKWSIDISEYNMRINKTNVTTTERKVAFLRAKYRQPLNRV